VKSYQKKPNGRLKKEEMKFTKPKTHSTISKMNTGEEGTVRKS
jgi:hypothetical protein